MFFFDIYIFLIMHRICIFHFDAVNKSIVIRITVTKFKDEILNAFSMWDAPLLNVLKFSG